jgi:hypothetical protein
MVLPFHKEMGTAYYETVLAMFVHTIEVAYGAMKTIGQSSAKGRMSMELFPLSFLIFNIALLLELYFEALKGSNKPQMDHDRLSKLVQQSRDLIMAAIAKEDFEKHKSSI